MTVYRCNSRSARSPAFAGAPHPVASDDLTARRWHSLGSAGLAAALLLSPVTASWALSTDPVPGAPIQLGVPAGATTSGSTGGTNQGGISTTPLPAPVTNQSPTIQQPTINQPTVTQPTVAEPQVPVVAPIAQPTAPSLPAGASPVASSAAPGLFDDQHQGLGLRLWQGSSAAQLAALLPALSAPVTQPALRDLQLRLLLTQAPGPATSANGVDILVPLRAERLHAIGFDTEAMLLTKQVAGSESPDSQEAVEK